MSRAGKAFEMIDDKESGVFQHVLLREKSPMVWRLSKHTDSITAFCPAKSGVSPAGGGVGGGEPHSIIDCFNYLGAFKPNCTQRQMNIFTTELNVPPPPTPPPAGDIASFSRKRREKEAKKSVCIDKSLAGDIAYAVQKATINVCIFTSADKQHNCLFNP